MASIYAGFAVFEELRGGLKIRSLKRSVRVRIPLSPPFFYTPGVALASRAGHLRHAADTTRHRGHSQNRALGFGGRRGFNYDFTEEPVGRPTFSAKSTRLVFCRRYDDFGCPTQQLAQGWRLTNFLLDESTLYMSESDSNAFYRRGCKKTRVTDTYAQPIHPGRKAPCTENGQDQRNDAASLD